jgi:hypothetical protein
MALLRTLFGRRRGGGARSAPPVTTLAALGGTRSHVQRHDLEDVPSLLPKDPLEDQRLNEQPPVRHLASSPESPRSGPWTRRAHPDSLMAAATGIQRRETVAIPQGPNPREIILGQERIASGKQQAGLMPSTGKQLMN